VPGISTPMRRIDNCCCACAITGHAAAAPSPAMLPLGLDPGGAPISALYYSIAHIRTVSRLVATATSSDLTPKNLTERKFRSYWEQTDKAPNERGRFIQVLALMEEPDDRRLLGDVLGKYGGDHGVARKRNEKGRFVKSDTPQGDNVTLRERGNSAAYILARLDRDGHAELAAHRQTDQRYM
jgi:hypothetical protein